MHHSRSRNFAVFLAVLIPSLQLFAEEAAGSGSSGPYSVSLYGVYGNNETYGHTGGFDLVGYVDVNKYFELDAALEYRSPRSCAVSAFARPKLPLPVGELFLDGAINFRYFGDCSMGVFTASGSVGYRMDYVSVQLGISSRILIDMLRQKGSGGDNVSEPVNLTYRIAFNVRPAVSCWNIGIGVANYTLYEFERAAQPIFFIGGHYDFHRHLTAVLETDLKPAGIFHMNARYWGVNVRAGIKYGF